MTTSSIKLIILYDIIIIIIINIEDNTYPCKWNFHVELNKHESKIYVKS
jgi:hypothetical protein